MSTKAENPFDATPSLVGYLYQCRYALYASLHKLREFNDDFSIEIESLDDIVFGHSNSALEILQTKNHTVRAANLTNASPDLWRSIRIWCEGITDGRISTDSIFYLITTSVASQDSAAFFLKDGSLRDVQKAIDYLDSTAKSSDSKENKPAYSAFNKLSQIQKQSLFTNVFIIDKSPSIKDLDKKIKQEIYFAVNHRLINSFLDRLEGWWYRKIINHLNGSSTLLTSYDLRLEIENISGQIRDDNLPIDDDILKATIDATGFQERVFVKQLKFIGIHERRIFFAIENFFRAREQRSRWVEEYLISGDELTNYEDILYRQWEIRDIHMKGDFKPDTSSIEKTEKVKEIYKWVEIGDHHPIRKFVTQPFIAQGTYQILADENRIKWHPDFNNVPDSLSQGDTSL